MKKLYVMFSAIALWSGLACASVSAAEQPVNVFIDGKKIKLDVQPVLENGTTLVQFRPIFERLGLKVSWEPQSQTVTGTKKGLEIILGINSREAFVNGARTELELAPRLVDGYTLVPIRFVGEASGKEVEWDAATSSIFITDPMGKGKYVYPDGNVYIGELNKGTPEGKGKLYNQSGKLLFDGIMRNGAPDEGSVKSYYENGKTKFAGSLKNGVENGPGKQYTDDGKLLFDGSFVNGYREKGTLYYDNGDMYIGPFDHNEPNGTGKIVYKNKDVYEGDVLQGKREGKGTYTTPKGDKIVGEYQNDKLNGTVNRYDKQGILISVSEFVNDVMIRQLYISSDTGNTPFPGLSSTGQSSALKAENDRHAKVLQQLTDAYNGTKKQVEDQIAQLRKNNPGVYTSKAQYDKALADANQKQTDAVNKLNALQNDSSSLAGTARVELNKQLAEIQTLIRQINDKYSAFTQIEALKEQLTQIKNQYDADVKKENDLHADNLKKLK